MGRLMVPVILMLGKSFLSYISIYLTINSMMANINESNPVDNNK